MRVVRDGLARQGRLTDAQGAAVLVLATHAEAVAESRDCSAVRAIPEQVTALPALYLGPEAARQAGSPSVSCSSTPTSRCCTTAGCGSCSPFPAVRAAVETVMPLVRLSWIAFAHLEADEHGAVNEFLGAAPHAQAAGAHGR